MGSDKRVDTMAYSDEQPQFTCSLINKPYRISRYQVTNAQYQAFVEADGYRDEQFWTEDGWRWRQSEDADSPRDFGPLFQAPNHPRVGVSWYEAVAYCSWLSERLGYTVRLPSEAEWERAAAQYRWTHLPMGR